MTKPHRPSLLVGGLRLALRHPSAVVWTFAASLLISLVSSLGLHAQLSAVLSHSLAAERLNSAFDLGTLLGVLSRIGHRVPPTGVAPYTGLPLYFLIYFILVPGTLFSYHSDAPSSLSILVSSGLGFFWRFVRITLLTVLVSGLILGPLFALQAVWSDHVSERVVGISAFYQNAAGLLVILLVAVLLRLYFDLVEVYTVQLADFALPSGKPDRRVRKTLLPALKTLWHNLPGAAGSFLLIAAVGIAALFFCGRAAVESLAQPRVWPQFLLIQAGLFVNLFARFWQRGMETVLAERYALPSPKQSGYPPEQSETEPLGPFTGETSS